MGEPDVGDMARGRALLDLDRTREAHEAFSRARELQPDSPEPIAWQIASLGRERSFKQAEALSLEATNLFPTSEVVFIACGRLRLEQYRFEEAVAAFRTAYHLSTGGTGGERALRWLVAGLRKLRRFDEIDSLVAQAGPRGEALVEYAHSLADRRSYLLACRECEKVNDPDERVNVDALACRVGSLRHMRWYDEAIRTAKMAIEQVPRAPQLHVELGRIHLDRIAHDDALTAFDQALAIDPDHASALEWRVTALRRLRRWDDAETAITEAIHRRPDEPNLYLELGYLRTNRYDFNGALAACERALAIDPFDEDALEEHCAALRSLRRWDEAETATTQAIQRRPDEPNLYLQLGYLRNNRYDFEGALAAYDQALAIDPDHAPALEWRVTALRSLRRWDEADTAITEAIQRRPDATNLYLELGYLRNNRYDFEGALAACEQALAIDPCDEDALEARCRALRRLRRWEEAETAITEAIQRRPDEPNLYLELGSLRHDRYDFEGALAAYEQALAVDPDHDSAPAWRCAAFRQMRRWDEAETAITESIQRRPDEPNLYLELGSLRNDRYDFGGALAAVDQALTIDPDNAWTLARRCAALRQLRRWDEAETTITQAIRLLPNNVFSYLELGYLRDERYNFEGALAAFDQALAVDPDNDSALAWRSAAFRQMRRWDDAEVAVTQALQRRPDAPNLYLELGHLRHSRQDFNGALAAYEQALTIDPDNVWALAWRCGALRRLRRWDEAETAITQALQRRPDEPHLYLELGYLRDALYDFEGALAAYEQALTIDPDDDSALAWRCEALRQMRRWDEAEVAVTQALQRRPDEPNLHLELGYLRNDLYDFEGALAAFEQALAIDPDDVWAVVRRCGALRRLRRWDEAETAITQALQRRPNEVPFHLELGYLRDDRDDDYAGALEASELALAIDPYHVWGLERRIAALRNLQRWDEAEAVITEALQSRPNEVGFHLELCYLRDALYDFEGALAAAETALTLSPPDEQALIWRVRSLRNLRAWERAETAAREAVVARPYSSAIRNELAAVLTSVGRYAAALEVVSEILASSRRNERALVNKIRLLSHLRQFSDALAHGRKACQTRPDSVDALVELGLVYAAVHKDKQAYVFLDKALSLEPHETATIAELATLLRRERRFEEAERLIRSELARRPTDDYLHIQLGHLCNDQLLIDDALESYNTALRHNPNNPVALASRSSALRSLGRYTEAARSIDNVLQSEPHHWVLAMEAGWTRHNMGQLSEARDNFVRLRQGAQSPEERSEALAAIGWVAFAEGDFATAEQQFRQAIEEAPRNRDYQLACAWALIRRNEPETLAQAEQIALGVLAQREDAPVLVCLGVVNFRLNNIQASEQYLKKAIDIDPYKGSHTDLASLYIVQGRYDVAERLLETALGQQGVRTYAQLELGILKLETDKPREAIGHFRLVLLQDPSLDTAVLGLAQALMAIDAPQQAEDALRDGIGKVVAEWRVQHTLARHLVQQAVVSNNDDLLIGAYNHAVEAVRTAPSSEADPHHVAAFCQVRLAGTAVSPRTSGSRRRAMRHLRQCLAIEPNHVEAQRLAHVLETELRPARTTTIGSTVVTGVAVTLLAVMWSAFFITTRVSETMIIAMTPILLGIVTIATLLPSIIRLRMPGFEADLEAVRDNLAGPTGNVVIRAGSLVVSAGPTGYPLGTPTGGKPPTTPGVDASRRLVE